MLNRPALAESTLRAGVHKKSGQGFMAMDNAQCMCSRSHPRTAQPRRQAQIVPSRSAKLGSIAVLGFSPSITVQEPLRARLQLRS